MIICGRGKRGKALTTAIVNALTKDGIVSVAALSEVGVEHVVKVGQAVANSMGIKVSADPERREIEVAPGSYKSALVMTFKTEDYEPAELSELVVETESSETTELVETGEAL